MKKSEMIMKMLLKFDEFENPKDINKVFGNDDIMEALLDECIKNGMVPPLTTIKVDFEGIDMYTDAFEWEDE